MTLKIAEIGMNHMGNERYFLKYLRLLPKKIDGVTLQIPKKESLSKSNIKCYLNDDKIIKYIRLLKEKFNLVGIATNNYEKIDMFSKLNIDFFKILSGSATDIKFINKILKTKVKKVYLSLGFNSFKDTKKVLEKIDKKKISLIHTSFDKRLSEINLKKITILKEMFGLPVAYGNHSEYLDCIPNSVFLEPCAIFFYVKLNKNLNYPDKSHAVNIKNINLLLDKIRENTIMLKK